MKDLFKIGDTVYHWAFNYGCVISFNGPSEYPLVASFKHGHESFTLDGRSLPGEPPTLSFTPYNLVSGGFSQVRPHPKIKPGQLIYVRQRESDMWQMRFFSHWGGGVIGHQPEVACFIDQAKNGTTTNWYFYSITNPLES